MIRHADVLRLKHRKNMVLVRGFSNLDDLENLKIAPLKMIVLIKWLFSIIIFLQVAFQDMKILSLGLNKEDCSKIQVLNIELSCIKPRLSCINPGIVILYGKNLDHYYVMDDFVNMHPPNNQEVKQRNMIAISQLTDKISTTDTKDSFFSLYSLSHDIRQT